MTPEGSASIPPQQAFDQLSRLRLKDHSMQTMLQEVADLTKVTVPGASEVSVSLVAEKRADTAVSTGELAADLDERQYKRGYGPCLDAAQHGEVMHIEDMSTETRWPDYTLAAVQRGALSSISLPITLDEKPALSAALNVYSTHPYAFDDAALRTALSLAGYAENMLANMHVHDSGRQLVQQLTAALESRPLIDQAIGMLMRDRSCTADEAFELLVTASQRTNRKLRLIAENIVKSVAPEATGRGQR